MNQQASDIKLNTFTNGSKYEEDPDLQSKNSGENPTQGDLSDGSNTSSQRSRGNSEAVWRTNKRNSKKVSTNKIKVNAFNHKEANVVSGKGTVANRQSPRISSLSQEKKKNILKNANNEKESESSGPHQSKDNYLHHVSTKESACLTVPHACRKTRRMCNDPDLLEAEVSPFN